MLYKNHIYLLSLYTLVTIVLKSGCIPGLNIVKQIVLYMAGALHFLMTPHHQCQLTQVMKYCKFQKNIVLPFFTQTQPQN